MYVCTVCMAGYISVNCNRIIENKRNKTKKKKKKKKKILNGHKSETTNLRHDK